VAQPPVAQPPVAQPPVAHQESGIDMYGHIIPLVQKLMIKNREVIEPQIQNWMVQAGMPGGAVTELPVAYYPSFYSFMQSLDV
jgi:hypothetical protein